MKDLLLIPILICLVFYKKLELQNATKLVLQQNWAHIKHQADIAATSNNANSALTTVQVDLSQAIKELSKSDTALKLTQPHINPSNSFGDYLKYP